MAVAASSHAILDDDEIDPDYVPVSSWARQGQVRRVTPPSFDPTPLEYGPLTAQGNYLSQLDGVAWSQAQQPAVGVSDVSLEPFSGPGAVVAPGAFGVMPASAGMQDSAVAVAWNELAAEMADRSRYGLLDPTALPASSYQHVQTEPQLFAPPPADAQQYLGPVSSTTGDGMSRVTLGPWDGIWAFNPNNLEDNFVYPTNGNEPISPPMDPAAGQVISESATLGSMNLHSEMHQQYPHQHRHHQAPRSHLPGKRSEASATTMQPSPPMSAPVVSPESTSPQNNGPSPGVVGAPAPATAAGPSSSSFGLIVPRPHPKTLRPERVKRNKPSQALTTVPRRHGPLSSEQRQKADDMRYYGACWRCRRYKKPCNGPGECDTCRTSGFRVWPSTVGCYRGDMEDFIIGVMPGNAEVIMRELGSAHPRVPNWKMLFGWKPELPPLPLLCGEEDRFTKLSVKLQATRMAGNGFIELLDILANFQRTRAKPEAVLEHTCEALSYICDVYHAFVATDTPMDITPQHLMKALTEFRSHYSAIWRTFLSLCLSGRRSAWFPAFLSSCVNVPLLVVLKDGFTAIPDPIRGHLWPNISRLIEDLRTRLYPMGLDLLSALAKGTKPWKLECWRYIQSIDPETKLPIPGVFERDADGLRLLGGDVGAFDGFAAIQIWLERYRDSMVEGMSFLTTPPFSERNANCQPIAALAWIFEVTPPGKKIVNGHLVDDPAALDRT